MTEISLLSICRPQPLRRSHRRSFAYHTVRSGQWILQYGWILRCRCKVSRGTLGTGDAAARGDHGGDGRDSAPKQLERMPDRRGHKLRCSVLQRASRVRLLKPCIFRSHDLLLEPSHAATSHRVSYPNAGRRTSAGEYTSENS